MSRKGLVRLAAVAGLLLIAAALVFLLYLRPLPVEVARPQGDVAIEVYGLGAVEARIASQVAFEVGNTLVGLDADHGDRVVEGQVLARLHRAEQEARVAMAAAGVERARADLERIRAAVEKAGAVLGQKRQINTRKQELVRRRVVSLETAEEAQTDVDVAEAELAVTRSELAVAQAALEDAKAGRDLEEVMLDHHVLTAPYDAVVVERHKELGSVLAPGEPVFTLADPATVWVLAWVDEARAGAIELGQPAAIRLRSLPTRTFPGKVARIGIESDRLSEERRVYVAFDEIPRRFHLNEQAEVLITTGRLRAPLLVPASMVDLHDGGSGTVWTVEDGRLARHEVTIGEQTLDGRLEIAGGLPAGALVVTAPASGLEEGRRAFVRGREGGP